MATPRDDTPAPGKVLTLRPSPKRWLLMIALSVVFIVVGTRIVDGHPLTGGLAIGFFGLCVLIGIVNLLPGASHLRLDDAGFEMRSLFRSHRVGWSDVAAFGVAQIALNRMVGWNFVAGHVGHERIRKLNTGLSGFEAALPDTYGRSANALAETLNAWRAARAGDAARERSVDPS